MSMIAYWTIRARLMQVPGVANVAIWGERIKIPQVQVDPKRMASYDVTLDEVMEITSDALDVGHAPVLQTERDWHRWIYRDPESDGFSIRHVSPIRSGRMTWPRCPSTTERRAMARRCAWATWPMWWRAPGRSSATQLSTDGPGLLLIVEKFPWANTLEVTTGRGSTRSTRLQPGLPDIKIDPTIFRPADFIEVAFDNLRRRCSLAVCS